MGFKTISVSDAAYQRLKKMKQQNESFSDEVMRLTQNQGKLSDLIGLFTKEEGDAIEKGIEKIRKSDRVRTWSY